MKSNLALNIKFPCTENFNTFSPTKKGGFCGSCKSEVIDFTKMNAAEIGSYVKNNTTTFTTKFKYKGRFDVHLKIEDDIIATYTVSVTK